MEDSSAPGLGGGSRSAPYRVRTPGRHERSVPDQVEAPRFATRDAAERYAETLLRGPELTVVVEKLAPGGCWLQLVQLG